MKQPFLCSDTLFSGTVPLRVRFGGGPVVGGAVRLPGEEWEEAEEAEEEEWTTGRERCRMKPVMRFLIDGIMSHDIHSTVTARPHMGRGTQHKCTKLLAIHIGGWLTSKSESPFNRILSRPEMTSSFGLCSI